MRNYDRILEILNLRNIDYKIMTHDDVEYEPEKVAKTLCFGAEGKTYLFVLKLSDRLDYKKVSRIVGVNRTKIKMLSGDELGQLGYKRGEVSPIALSPDLNEFIDEKIFSMEYIFCGCGDSNMSLRIRTKDLPKLTTYDIKEISI